MSDAILLHPEIEITPGQPGMFPTVNPYPPGQPLTGSAILRLTNNTGRENAYTVRLTAPVAAHLKAFWEDAWYTVEARPLPPGTSGTGLQPDRPGPQNRSVTLHIPNGMTRDALIRFDLPRHPNSRAGRYPFEIEVETRITGMENASRSAPSLKLPAVALVLPYYQWSAEARPVRANPNEAGPRVGRFFRRAAEFEVAVQNSGNDWLYCDLKAPVNPQNMTLDVPTLRLATRPPERDETLPNVNSLDALPGTERLIPLGARTRLRNLRGAEVVQQMPLALIRRDAPSVSPRQASVVDKATTETATPSGPQAIVYHPTIPDKLAQFPTRVFGSVRNMMMMALGLMILVPMTILAYHRWAYSTFLINPLASNVQPGQRLTIRGKLVEGADFYLAGALGGANGKPFNEKLKTEQHTGETGLKMDQIDVVLPTESNGFTGYLVAYHLNRFIPFLPQSWSPSTKQHLEIGNVAKPSVENVDAGPYNPGTEIDIAGKNLGSKGNLFLSNHKISGVTWSDTKIHFTIPTGLFNPGDDLTLEAQVDGAETRINAGSIKIASPAAPAKSGGAKLTNSTMVLALTGKEGSGPGNKGSGGPSGGDTGVNTGGDSGNTNTTPASVPVPEDATVIRGLSEAAYLDEDPQIAGPGCADPILAQSKGSATLLAAKAFLQARLFSRGEAGITREQAEASLSAAQKAADVQPTPWADALRQTTQALLSGQSNEERINAYSNALVTEPDCTPAQILLLGVRNSEYENSPNIANRNELKALLDTIRQGAIPPQRLQTLLKKYNIKEK